MRSSARSASTRLALLFLTGTALGIVLYRSLFGFTGAFRVLLAGWPQRRLPGADGRAGRGMPAVLSRIGDGISLGPAGVGFVSPVGISVAVGSLLFGVGMQLGGGCGSGTLFSVGGGNTEIVLTLLFFIVGSVVGVVHLAWWETPPSGD